MTLKDEKKTRKDLMERARLMGGQQTVEDLKHLFKKWDQLLALTPNAEEQLEIARIGIEEIQAFFDVNVAVGGLSINGEIIVPGGKVEE